MIPGARCMEATSLLAPCCWGEYRFQPQLTPSSRKSAEQKSKPKPQKRPKREKRTTRSRTCSMELALCVMQCWLRFRVRGTVHHLLPCSFAADTPHRMG